MFERYDILTIYDFYDDLGIKINNLLNYCSKNYNNQKLINSLLDIRRDYQTLVIKGFENYFFNLPCLSKFNNLVFWVAVPV